MFGRRIARLGSAPLRPFGRRVARHASTVPLRPFLVEQYSGWFDGSDSLSSSECEPLTLRQLLDMADGESRQQWEELNLGYPAFNTGSQALREQIVAQYDALSADGQVNVCAPQEGISLAMHALLEPGDHVIATTPCYQSLTEVARSIGCQITDWDPEFDGGRPWFSPDVLARLLRSNPGTRLLVANFPHNPTGALPTPAEFAAIVEECRRAGCALFVDEMYRGLEHSGRERLPAAVDAYPERGVSLGGLSKSYGLPGLRIGWLACRDTALMQQVSLLKDYSTICPPVPSEALGLIALRNRERIEAANRSRLALGLSAVRDFIHAHEAQFEWCEPAGGTMAFPRIRDADVSAEAYAEALRARAGLMLMPSSHFAFADDRLRVCFGRDTEATVERLARWSDDVARYGV